MFSVPIANATYGFFGYLRAAFGRNLPVDDDQDSNVSQDVGLEESEQGNASERVCSIQVAPNTFLVDPTSLGSSTANADVTDSNLHFRKSKVLKQKSNPQASYAGEPSLSNASATRPVGKPSASNGGHSGNGSPSNTQEPRSNNVDYATAGANSRSKSPTSFVPYSGTGTSNDSKHAAEKEKEYLERFFNPVSDLEGARRILTNEEQKNTIPVRVL